LKVADVSYWWLLEKVQPEKSGVLVFFRSSRRIILAPKLLFITKIVEEQEFVQQKKSGRKKTKTGAEKIDFNTPKWSKSKFPLSESRKMVESQAVWELKPNFSIVLKKVQRKKSRLHKKCQKTYQIVHRKKCGIF